MFVERIHIKKANDIRFGTTKIPYEKTYGEILALLRKHGCDRVATMRDGDMEMIGFELDEVPYMIKIPIVYVGDQPEDKIGVRLVKYWLETILELSKQRIIDMEYLMLGTRMVNIDGQNMTVKEAFDNVPTQNLLDSLSARTRQLKGDKFIDVED